MVPYAVDISEAADGKHGKTITTLTVDLNRLVNDLVERCIAEASRRAAAEAKLTMIELKAGTPRGAVEVEFEEVAE